MEMKPQKITPYLWFDQNAEEAVAFYLSLFEDSKIRRLVRWGEGGPVPKGTAMNISFELAGQHFLALNGGPLYRFSPAISLFVSCESQAEIDRLWAALEDGGKPNRCGWIDDRFGVTWQIVPSVLGALMGDPDPAKARRVGAAMMGMVKFDIAGLERAHRGEG